MSVSKLFSLHRADGSATYSSNGYSVIAAVNGPVEVQRRDELPEEAAIDVSIRPASGVGGIRERHLESIIETSLRHVILVSAHPRTLIQITLQIVAAQGDDAASGTLPQAESNLPVLPALLQASMLALLSTSIPLSMTLTATLIAIELTGNAIPDASPQDLVLASSVHVFSFSSLGDLLVAESEGDFTMEEWHRAHVTAAMICQGKDVDEPKKEDVSMDSEDGGVTLEQNLRNVVQGQIVVERDWRQSPS